MTAPTRWPVRRHDLELEAGTPYSGCLGSLRAAVACKPALAIPRQRHMLMALPAEAILGEVPKGGVNFYVEQPASNDGVEKAALALVWNSLGAARVGWHGGR